MRVRAVLWTFAGVLSVALVVGTPDEEALVKRLGERSARARDAAARQLRDRGAAAEPALARAAQSADPEVKARARALLELLAKNADTARAAEAEVAVRDALRSSDGLEPDSSVDRRLTSLEPQSGDVLASAARSLAAHGFVTPELSRSLARHATPDALATLAVCVRDERLFPSAALPASRDLDALFARDPQRAESLRARSDAARSSLSRAMRSPHAPTRRVATALFGPLATDDDVPALLEMTRDADQDVRAEACRVIGLYAPAQSAATLRETVSDPCAQVRTAALAALLAVPGTPHPEPAVLAAQDRSPAVRAAAANLLAREATPDTVQVLRTLSSDPSPRVRAAARRALAAFAI